MASDKTKTAIIIGVVALVVILVLGGITLAGLKMRAQMVQRKQLDELKATKPVEYYILHTANTQSADALRSAIVGTWHMKGLMNRQTGEFIFLPEGNGYFKMWTLTNWSIVTYDQYSNVLYTAGGRYTLTGDNYVESVELATGWMTRYLGAHPQYRIRVDGDMYYQMSAKPPKTGSPLEEMWQRVE